MRASRAAGLGRWLGFRPRDPQGLDGRTPSPHGTSGPGGAELVSAIALGLLLGVGGGALYPSSAQAQGRAGNETEEESVLKKAEEQFNQGNYDAAADLYDQAIKLNPSRVEAFVKRATLFFREHKYDRAIELLTRAEKLSTSDLSIKTVLGLCLYESGQKARGLSYLEDVTRVRPETYDAQFQIGKHYARLDPVRASTALEQYFKYRPEEQKVIDPSAQLFLGTAYFLRNKLKEAQKLLELAQEARPRDNQVRQMLGTVYIGEGEWAKGAAQYEPLRSDISRRPAVAFNLATCYLHQGNLTEARTLAKQYESLRPDDPRVLSLLAAIDQASEKEADLREALKKYQAAQEALKAKPDYQTHVNLPAAISRTYMQLREPKKAAEVAESGLTDIESKSGTNHDLLAAHEVELAAVLLEARLQQMNQGRIAPGSPAAPQGLLTMADRLAQLAPGDADVLALAGSGAYGSGNYDRARELYTQSRLLDAKQPRARIGLSRALEQKAISGLLAAFEERDSGKERDRERREAERATERSTALVNANNLLREARQVDENPGLLRNQAAIMLLQNNPAEAERALQPALSGAGKNDPTLWLLQSRTQQLLGRPQQAVEAAERAVTEAKKLADAVPATDSARKLALSNRLAQARIELGARYLTADSKEDKAKEDKSKERERLDRAVELLEQAVRDLGTGSESKELLRAGQRNLALSHLRRGRLRLVESEAQVARSGGSAAAVKQAEDALADIQRAIELGTLDSKGSEQGNAECLGALAATHAGQYKLAKDLVGRAKEDNCEMAGPYNRLGPELVSVFVQYKGATASTQREQVLKTLPKLQSRAGSSPDSQTLLRVLRALLYSTNVTLAYDYHQQGRPKLVGPALRAAQKVGARTSDDDDAILQHNLAIADLADGKAGSEKVLERLGSRPPEALVNLGILSDRRGEARKALDLYRRALERGARTPKLREWIDTKDRLLGPGTGQAQ